MATSQEYVSNMTSTGQLILPQEIRSVLGIKTQGKVVFRVVKDKVEVMSEAAAKESAPSTAEQVLGSLPGLALEALAAMDEAIRDNQEEAKPAAKPKPKAKPKTTAKPKTKPKAKPKAAVKPKAAAKPKTTAKPKAKTTTKPKSTAKAS